MSRRLLLPSVPRSAAARLAQVAAVAALASSASCLKVDFDPASVVSGVRILGARADKPFAKPGDTVELEVLAYDGRADKPKPMEIYWVPLACFNPPRDLYYLCFAQFARGQGNAQAGGAEPQLPLTPGFDLTALLPKGPKYSVTLPANIISSRPPSPGAAAPYGLAIVFNIACAGRVKLEAPSDNPQSVPLGCYDDAGQKLGPDDYVVGFSRIYAYADKANQNPAIDGVTFDGKPVGPEGIAVDRCTKPQARDCDTKKIGVTLPDGVWEENDLSRDEEGRPVREQVWATFHATHGRFDSELRLLFDTRSGRVEGSDNEWRVPRDPSQGFIWVVVRDNRGGTSWRAIPLTVR